MKTPVLYCIFNRLDVVKKTFEPIRAARPERLYIAADGPRLDKPGEKELTEKVRKYILDNVDWDCEVKTLYRDKNIGCELAMSGAVAWFFSYEEKGIILEDDILTCPEFFQFCEQMLNFYENSDNITYISGYNFLSNITESCNSYYFLPEAQAWGWATWRKVLYPEKHNVMYNYIPNIKDYHSLVNRGRIIKTITKRKDLQSALYYDLFFESRWDNNFISYLLTHFPNAYSIMPSKSLTSHIGDNGYHFNGENNFDIPIDNFDMENLIFRKAIEPDREFQDLLLEKIFYSECFRKYGRENIDVKAVKQDYYKIKSDIITSFLKWFYYRYIKFMKKRAKTIQEQYLHNKYLLTTIEPFYIYTKYYYKKS